MSAVQIPLVVLPFPTTGAVLHHRGHGPDHWDLVIAHGSRGPTLSVRRGGLGWQAAWLPAHRRRYLTFQGPVSGGRGVVKRCWAGRVRCVRRSMGWRIACGHGTTLKLRGSRLDIDGPWPPRTWDG